MSCNRKERKDFRNDEEQPLSHFLATLAHLAVRYFKGSLVAERAFI